MAASTEGQTTLNTVAAEDVVGDGPELDELRKAVATICDDDIVETARKLNRAKSAIKDLLGSGDGEDRTILVDENWIITEKHGERPAMKSDQQEMRPSVRRSFKPTG